MRLRWFGESWGAPICDPQYKVDTPVDSPCLFCPRPIVYGDQGLVMAHYDIDSVIGWRAAHLDCFLEEIGAMVMSRE